jgi:hypothetical protein
MRGHYIPVQDYFKPKLWVLLLVGGTIQNVIKNITKPRIGFTQLCQPLRGDGVPGRFLD